MKTIGMVEVAALAASAGAEPPVCTECMARPPAPDLQVDFYDLVSISLQ